MGKKKGTKTTTTNFVSPSLPTAVKAKCSECVITEMRGKKPSSCWLKLDENVIFKIILPPKNFDFCVGGGGVVFFLDNFIRFLVWDTKKVWEKVWGKADVLEWLSADANHFRPFYDFVKFKKSVIFSIFRKIWKLFFFSKYNFGPNWS